jgi:GNAT superfamily N-acetyltransferase
VAHIVLRKLRNAWRLAHKNPRRLIRHYCVRLDVFEVYWKRVDAVPPPELPPGISCVPLSDDELKRLPQAFAVQTDRFQRLGFNSAYAVYVNGVPGHVAWLITPELDELRATRILKLRQREAEIAHCLTAPEFRGQGLYGIAIRTLAEVARRKGIRDIYMIVLSGNKVSAKGILSAGLVLRARSIRVWLMPDWNGRSFLWRGQRWPAL